MARLFGILLEAENPSMCGQRRYPVVSGRLCFGIWPRVAKNSLRKGVYEGILGKRN